MNILVTGGAGYIGSHTCVELLNAGHEIIIVDNFYNSKPEVLNRIRKITSKDFKFYEVDLLNEDKLTQVFKTHVIDAVIHFAGLKAVGESVEKPGLYYHNNITGTLNLLKVMKTFNVNQLVFSSSATVYGMNNPVPFTEDMPTSATNPYGRSKLMIEKILMDFTVANPKLSITLLRYFNPIGAHESGLIGEDPSGIPNNLMPYITQVAIGKREKLSVFGDDYDTPDGTGVRDYIHVVDLALGHLKALDYLNNHTGVEAINLGTGIGYSVLDVVKAFKKASGRDIPYEITNRRPGDIGSCYAEVSKAKRLLQWETRKDLDDMCADSWRWQKNNPKGYA